MAERLSANQEFERDSKKWHGRILRGQYAHWCDDWDDLPIDETCMEFTACTCYSGSAPVAEIQHTLRCKRERERSQKDWEP